MRTLARVAARPTGMAEPLPNVMRSWDKAHIHLRRGQVTMLAALPGGGKTWLATYLAVRWVQSHNLTCMYFSADSDETTMATRAAAMMLRLPQHEVEEQIAASDPGVIEVLGTLEGLRFSFNTDPDWPYVDMELSAFSAVYGDYPDVIVVDNLMNIVPTNENEFTSLKDSTKALHRVAHATGAAVLVLHHLNESEVKEPLKPAPRKCVTGKVSQVPAAIYTLAFDPHDAVMRLACVKQRSGQADPNAESWLSMGVDPERMLIGSEPNAALTGGWA